MESYKHKPPEQSTPFSEVFSAALDLPPDTRAALAYRLLESLDNPDYSELNPAWVEEIERRIRDIDEGKVKLIPGEEVLAKLRSRYK